MMKAYYLMTSNIQMIGSTIAFETRRIFASKELFVRRIKRNSIRSSVIIDLPMLLMQNQNIPSNSYEQNKKTTPV